MKPVWIVDDDRSIRWVFEKVLSREGISYNSFASAREVLDALSGGAPQVLISDIRMPGMSGLDLQAKLNADRCPIPTIFITAHGDEDMRLQAMRGGAVKFMVKPFDCAILLESVRAALEADG